MRPIPVSKKSGEFTFDEPLALRKHEFETLEKLRRFGDAIHRIAESNIEGEKRPDIKWRGEKWEVKTIAGSSRNNIFHAMQSAKGQCKNVVVDVPRTKRQPDAILRDVMAYLGRSRVIKKVFVMIGQSYCIIEKSLL